MAVTSFASGPTTLPQVVREALRRDISEWRGSRQSVLSLPFTSIEFRDILAETEMALRSLLDIPPQYRVLFLQGGAFAQFALIPLNIAGSRSHADYVETGLWSRRAMAEAAPWVGVRVAARGDEVSLPTPATWQVSTEAAYCHYTSNETADGLQYQDYPDTGDVPLVADMSADLMTRPTPVGKFGLIYASGQKNLGAAGLTMVIVREDLLGRARAGTPAPLDYTRQANDGSRLNTPPTFAVAVALRMLQWLAAEGGVRAAEQRSIEKSAKLYSFISRDGFYSSPVRAPDRSCINVRFHLPTPDLEQRFLTEASLSGLLHLAGHPRIGGVRANLYNPVTLEAVEALARFMTEFRRRMG